MEKNKITTLVIVVLAAGLILETGYLIGLKKQEARPHLAMGGPLRPITSPPKIYHLPQPAAAPMNREQDGFLTNLDQMQKSDPSAEIARMQEGMRQMVASASAMGQMIANDLNTRYNVNSLFRSADFFVPNIDIRDAKDAYEVNADLPGMKKEDIAIELEGRYLTISGERKSEESVQKEGYYRQESNYGRFSRTIALPEDAKVNGITSEYKNGVLSIRIPKTESAKAAKPSPVKVLVQ